MAFFRLLSVLFLIFIIQAIDGAEPSTREIDYLIVMKQALSDPYHHLDNWINTTSPCTFNGVKCDNTSTHVVEIDLGNFLLEGPFPSVVCNLQNLMFLSLSNNSISGELPKGIVSCTKLRHLDLSQNYLTDVLPGFISELSTLEYLDLSSNNFSGPIPPDFAKLENLQTLSLLSNLLVGTIPGFLGNMRNLVELYLADNPFESGVIPWEIGKMSKLQHLFLRRCHLQGAIPDSISGLSELVTLDVSINNLTGPWPGWISSLTKLNSLQLYVNGFSGEIPQDIGKMISLEKLDASQNNFTGHIPESLGNLNRLTTLHLFENGLTGEIPASLEGLTLLNDLSLYANSLHGKIPQKLGSNTQLEFFDLSNNQLSGPLPPQLCSGGKLSSLILFDNMLSGDISQLWNCTSLFRLRLANNQFDGEVPKGLWGLPGLSLLQLSSNRFEKKISADIGKAKNLWKLEIDDNEFSGELPAEIGMISSLEFFNASHNKFSGSLPNEFSGLDQLEQLDLAGNSFSGPVFSSINSLIKLIHINLKGNELSGEIPFQIGNLQSLSYLDLSDNDISGQVPASLANLNLVFLNLSKNQLSGSVPGGLNKYKGAFLDNSQLCGENFADIKPCVIERGGIPSKIWILCGLLVSAVMVLIVGLGCFYKKYYVLPRIKRKEKINFGLCNVVSFHKLVFREHEIIGSLDEANMIGSGGAGKVYKVDLGIGETVAVKRLSVRGKVEDSGYDNGFRAEIETLGTARHKNIVKLWCCISGEDSNLLVYEYMPNGSMGEILHGPKASSFDWPRRYTVAFDSAQGLAYLHHDCNPPIIHRDIKSNNILLDEEFHARVSDFGLARILEKCEKGYETMSAVAGSYGYIAPEFSYTLKVTTKSDVYSFGVLLLELVTGKRPVDSSYGEGANIVKWVSRMLEKENGVRQVLDPQMSELYRDSMLAVLRTALDCTNSLPTNRPTMRNVVVMLQDANPHHKSKLSPRNVGSHKW